ncbi:serine carboxypeptidase [Mycena pura]|uniref:Carboxypeptidase n=1 Tax=Mycena pura TaxID=153505 RepID=A0AAD6XXM4_9AGAR|nr:serine carboxypeptidase [Mycena pura]
MSLRRLALALLCICAKAFGTFQAPFSTPANIQTNPNFAPAGTLDILSEGAFTAFAHPAFSNYGVRIKKSRFCDSTVKYACHLFFYCNFFESRSNPDKDDVIFWTNGGPGCSSGLGLLMELGPCRLVNAENGTVFHPESWNSNANVFFIDQPIGVGFSYAEYGEHVSTTEEGAQDIDAFVAIFFAHFSKFQGRGFHMAGESYGGRYLPVYAAAVYDQNPLLIEAGIPPINLTSVMIGNGMTDVLSMMPGWYKMQCTPASIAPVQNIQTCVQMKARLPRCTKWLNESCHNTFEMINCAAAMSFCDDTLMDPYASLGLNNYDLTRQCGESGECYEEMDEIVKYLNQKGVQARLGAEVTQYTSCSRTVGSAFEMTLDMMKGAKEYVAALLERDVRVLVCAWTLALEWSGQAALGAQPLREWTVDGKRAGRTRSARGFTFATVDAAGHLVPYDKPKESLEMVKRWISGQEL